MKFLKNYFLFLVLAFVFIIVSCNKNEEASSSNLNTDTEINEPAQNEATWIIGDDSSKGFWLRLKIFVGHTADQCGGKCIKLFGKYYHADCRGFGYICQFDVEATVLGDISENELRLILTDHDAFGDFDIFTLPDRSLYITNPQNSSEQWLNIPEQILLRDSSAIEVIIQNVWFSEEQELENE